MSRSAARASCIAVFCALCATLAACGSGGGGSDANQQITDTLTAGLKTNDPTVLCTKTFSTGFVQRIYGSPAKCIAVETKNAKTNQPATGAKVTAIKVDGGTATAVVAVTGGDDDGATGALSLVQQGKGWRVEDLSTALLRSQFEAGVRNERSLAANLKSCIAGKVRALDDAAFRSLATGAMGDQPASLSQVKAITTDCFAETSASTGSSGSASGAPSVLRKKFEEGVSQSLKQDGISAGAITCVERKLRSAISDKQILALIAAGGKDTPASITQATAGAMAACNATK